MNDLLRDAIANLQTCFSGSKNTQELLLRVKTILYIYHPNFKENEDKITSVEVYTGRFKETIKTTFHKYRSIAEYPSTSNIISCSPVSQQIWIPFKMDPPVQIR
jgi:hypothetical protein